MTMIILHEETGNWLRLRPPSWISRVVTAGFELRASWQRRRNLRILGSLPADTLKDIGWPANDTIRK
ncbi:DUF1127 domain-containing protein [Rhizobium rhizogenes]|uniref:DUF1127 domain-containing protein n=1 Tax=Rhizobium rhizogenes TaxID=359 RepID=A0AA92C5H5_RHIRH|nr:DUF1127 domain-containing protein [Rhizobium rhizogenes]PVE56354.1 hypothetical protein DC430_00710 [Rhizobium rhizogenes]PVE64849.1 hypothetical protein DC415_13910 [Agrobacterium tumefaciens]PVE73987.1 hypothetical protein DCP16_13910 [Sphingomonas sp. TPD3009]